MTAVQAIQSTLESTQNLLNMFIADFSDADLLVRPVPGANHAAWQIGNVIVGDIWLVTTELPNAKFPALPDNFMKQHGKDGATDDNAAHFLTKAGYQKLLAEVRAAVIAELHKHTDADLDKPCTSDIKAFASNRAKLFLSCAEHTMMHAGQFSVIRRKLGKPHLM